MKKMIFNRVLLTMMLFVSMFAFVSCGSEDDSPPITNTALVGTWRLNHATVKANVPGMGELTVLYVWNGKTQSIDVSAEVAGMTIPVPGAIKDQLGQIYGELTFAADKTFASYEYHKGRKSLSEHGTYALNGKQLLVKSKSGSFVYKVSMNGNKQATFRLQSAGNSSIQKMLTSLTMTLDKQ